MNDNVKYFICPDIEEAGVKAAEYFGCAPDGFELEDCGRDSGARLYFAVRRGTVDMDGFYRLLYEREGVVLEVYGERGEGAALNVEEALAYVKRKNMSNVNNVMLPPLMRSKRGRGVIAPAQLETILNEDAEITISKDGLECSMELLPADSGGTMFDRDSLKRKLTASGVVYGISDEVMMAALAEHAYGKTYEVAKGVPPEDGEDGFLEYNFRLEVTGMPNVPEEGKADFRTLDLFEPVKKEQLVIKRILATEGTSGTAVTGVKLPPKRGKEAVMPKSRNVEFNVDKTEGFAKCSGLVKVVNGELLVLDTYSISGDCDMSVGNIVFDGNIAISGNVIPGLDIRATGNITIGGGVETSCLTAGGNIVVKRGIQGLEKSRIEAGGSVTALYIERATVVADENVYAGSIIHSSIECGKSLYMRGKRGNVMGGIVRASEEVVARFLGSPVSTHTIIEVGFPPKKRERVAFLESELKRLRGEVEKLEQLAAYLSKSKSNLTDENRRQLKAQSVQTLIETAGLNNKYATELNGLKEEARLATGGKVHVFNTVYPGVTIVIASASSKTSDNIQFATFVYRDGNIIFLPCEAKRED